MTDAKPKTGEIWTNTDHRRKPVDYEVVVPELHMQTRQVSCIRRDSETGQRISESNGNSFVLIALSRFSPRNHLRLKYVSRKEYPQPIPAEEGLVEDLAELAVDFAQLHAPIEMETAQA